MRCRQIGSEGIAALASVVPSVSFSHSMIGNFHERWTSVPHARLKAATAAQKNRFREPLKSLGTETPSHIVNFSAQFAFTRR